jgi:cob(I)alamin adenosyltransferase
VIQVYTGDGKGKTTAAIGQAVRAAGQGLNVVLIQFLKESKRGMCDAATLRRLGLPLTVEVFGEDILEAVVDDKRRQIKARVAEGLDFARLKLRDGIDMMILDEISHAVNLGLCTVDEVLRLLDSVPEKTEILLTGRQMPDEFMSRADLITEMKKIRHPFDKGITARGGIEY